VGRLGVGGMGEVYRADDLELGQSVALKFLSEEMETDTGRLERFLGEVRTARQVAHPNVCRVYDVGEIDGRRFLSMEYVDGEDLSSLLRRIGRLPEDKGVEFARQMAAGLAAMHDRGVLHRDLKPANVMIDGRGRVRLTDFGLATDVEQAAREKDYAGTPAYMAPEQLVGEPLTPQTDLYALGLVFHELFTGKRYHQGARQPDTEGRRAPSASGSETSAVNPAIEQVIERCLEKDPRRRPASAVAVAAALPGGDPLAAALAAGETPSPQMVADAGEEGELTPKVAVPLLVALFVLMTAVAWIGGRTYYQSYVAFPYSTDVLNTKAQEMLGRLGYQDPPADAAYGFATGSAYSDWQAAEDQSLDRWQDLGNVNPPDVFFWHRTSPRNLTPMNFISGGPGGGVVVGTNDPPRTRPGMTLLTLHPDGRLVSLEVLPPDKEAAPAGGVVPDPDWPLLFAEAELDMDQFTPAEPEWLGSAYADTRAAWVGAGADSSGAELRVEAAAYRGRPVYFELIAPWTTPLATPATGLTTSQTINNAIAIPLLLGIFGTGIALAVRHTRLGRADRRGAIRLAVAAGLVALAGEVLGTDFSNWLLSIPTIISWACLAAVLVWTFYTAIEPYVRRRWPETLISWTRLLDGRWRDPRVGRDMLIGSVLGLATGLVGALSFFAYDWRGTPPTAPQFFPPAWAGPLQTLGNVLQALQTVALTALGFLLLLVMFRIVLRSERAAVIGFAVLIVGLGTLQDPDPLVAFILGVPVIVGMVLVVTRLGLVALVSFFFISGGPAGSIISFSTPEFMTGSMVVAIASVLAPGIFGFYTSLGGRKAAAARLLDD
jgi:serine/threonine-protein kinase